MDVLRGEKEREQHELAKLREEHSHALLGLRNLRELLEELRAHKLVDEELALMVRRLC